MKPACLVHCMLLSLLPYHSTVADWWRPGPNTLWQWQLSALPADLTQVADMYDLDYFDTPADHVALLHARNVKVICYINVGAWEEWRDDAGQYPPQTLGKDYAGWPGEKWLDIRRLDLLAPIIEARMDLCKDKGFDGIEPDNIAGFEENTGFDLSYDDQLNFNRWLAQQAHARGLSIGLKNDNAQVQNLLASFDWALSEDCFDQGWCEDLLPFIQAGKAVFSAEYTDAGTTTEQFCPLANRLGFQAILKKRELDDWRKSCGGNEYYLPGSTKLELGTLIAGDNYTYAYSNAIELSNTQIESMATLNLRSPQIHLLNGFLAASGSAFRARQ